MDKERTLHRIAFMFNLLLERNRVQAIQDEGQNYLVSRIKGGYMVTFQDEHKDMVVVGRLIRKGVKYIPEAA